ncbi:MAG: hypothetical protein ABIP94_13380, partial [Planctomycetota bacterium]
MDRHPDRRRRVTRSALGGGVNGNVYALLPLPNGQLVVGGLFTLAGGAPAGNVALWNGTTWSAMAGGANAVVYALAPLPNGDIVAAGAFTQIGALAGATYVARWNGVTWSVMNTFGGWPFSYAVRTLAVEADGNLLAGGTIFTSNGSVARWNGTVWYPAYGGLGQVEKIVTLPDGSFYAVSPNTVVQRLPSGPGY